MLPLLGATALLILTILLIVTQPRGLNEAWAALIGAAAMLLCRFASLTDLWQVTREVSSVLLFLLGMMVLTAATERSGLFDLLALWTARAARGSGRALFVGVFLLGFIITALLSLDVTVLVLTPIVYALVRRVRAAALPFMFVCTFVANTGSLILPISNLTNLLVYGLLGLSFTDFARLMALPQVVALTANIAIFLVYFRRQIPRYFDSTALPTRPEHGDPVYRRVAALVLGAVLLALFIAGVRGWSIAAPALIGGALLALVAVGWNKATPRDLAAEVSWGLFPFVIGMFTVIRGAENRWLTQLGDVPTPTAHDLPALLVAAFGTALGANLVNNIPMVAATIGVLQHATPSAREPLALAAILGGNIGPTVTPFGSLATLIWLAIIRRKGERLSALAYMRVSIITAPPTLLAAVLALWLVLR